MFASPEYLPSGAPFSHNGSSNMDYFLELFLGGLTRGSIYALIALGYTMVYGIVQLINYAHGEIYMIGAFTALIVTGVLTLSVSSLAQTPSSKSNNLAFPFSRPPEARSV